MQSKGLSTIVLTLLVVLLVSSLCQYDPSYTNDNGPNKDIINSGNPYFGHYFVTYAKQVSSFRI